MSEHQHDWVESIEVHGQWGLVAGWQAEADEAWAAHVEDQ